MRTNIKLCLVVVVVSFLLAGSLFGEEGAKNSSLSNKVGNGNIGAFKPPALRPGYSYVRVPIKWFRILRHHIRDKIRIPFRERLRLLPPEERTRLPFGSDQVIVKFKDVSQKEINRILKRIGATDVRPVFANTESPLLKNIYVVYFNPAKTTIIEVIAKLLDTGKVEYTEPNNIIRLDDPPLEKPAIPDKGSAKRPLDENMQRYIVNGNKTNLLINDGQVLQRKAVEEKIRSNQAVECKIVPQMAPSKEKAVKFLTKNNI